MDLAVYWRYERISNPTPTMDTTSIDACLVFTGPSKPIPEFRTEDIAEEFSKCISEYTGSDACRIPPMIWSPLSFNKVSIAYSLS
jgi:hypothetical protein